MDSSRVVFCLACRCACFLIQSHIDETQCALARVFVVDDDKRNRQQQCTSVRCCNHIVKRKQSVRAWIRCSNNNIKERERENIFSLLASSNAFCSFCGTKVSMYFSSFSRSYARRRRRCCYVVPVVHSFSFTGQCLLRACMHGSLVV